MLPTAWTATRSAAASHVLTLNLTLNLILNGVSRACTGRYALR